MHLHLEAVPVTGYKAEAALLSGPKGLLFLLLVSLFAPIFAKKYKLLISCQISRTLVNV